MNKLLKKHKFFHQGRTLMAIFEDFAIIHLWIMLFWSKDQPDPPLTSSEECHL